MFRITISITISTLIHPNQTGFIKDTHSSTHITSKLISFSQRTHLNTKTGCRKSAKCWLYKSNVHSLFPYTKICSYQLKQFHKDTSASSLPCNYYHFFFFFWQIKADSFHVSAHRTKCAWEWERCIKIVGCQRCTMHHDGGIMGNGDQGRIWERNRGNKEQDRGGRRKWQEERKDKRGWNMFFFFFSCNF